MRQTHSKHLAIVVILYIGYPVMFTRADFIIDEVRNCGPEVNTAAGEYGASVSADGLTLYFSDGAIFPARPDGDGMGDIWVTHRDSLDSAWKTPIRLDPPVNTSAVDGCPCLSPDGLSLFFSSNRSGGFGEEDLYIAQRADISVPWADPVNLGQGVNSNDIEIFPTISPDGLTLYFCRLNSGNGDIYVATRKTIHEPFGTAKNLGPPVNSPGKDDNCPYIMPDGRTLFYTTEFLNGGICFSRRVDIHSSWGQPKFLGAFVNTGARSGTSMTADGMRMFFHGSYTETGHYGNSDIWEVVLRPRVDLNGDGEVDSADISCLTEHWYSSDPLCDIAPTLWGDGIVDEQDLLELASYLEPGFGRIAHWKLDETEGGIAYDCVGAYHADIIGEALWLPDAGMLEGALQLDGTDDYIAPALVLDPQDGPFRMTAWIQGGAPGQVIASQLPEADTTVDFLYLAADPEDGTLMTQMVLPNMPLDSGIVITDGQWHEVGFEWDGDYRHLTVDGFEVVDELTLPAFAFDQSGWLDIGKGKQRQPDTFWSGLIDEVKVFKKGTKP